VASMTVALSSCHAVRANLQKISQDFSQHIGHVRATVERWVQELRNRMEQDEEKLQACLTTVRENGDARFLRDRQEVYVCVISGGASSENSPGPGKVPKMFARPKVLK